MRKYYELVKFLSPSISYEEIEQICKLEGLDPVLLFILLNDKYIKESRPDLFKEIENIEDIEPIEHIEDWI